MEPKPKPAKRRADGGAGIKAQTKSIKKPIKGKQPRGRRPATTKTSLASGGDNSATKPLVQTVLPFQEKQDVEMQHAKPEHLPSQNSRLMEQYQAFMEETGREGCLRETIVAVSEMHCLACNVWGHRESVADGPPSACPKALPDPSPVLA